MVSSTTGFTSFDSHSIGSAHTRSCPCRSAAQTQAMFLHASQHVVGLKTREMNLFGEVVDDFLRDNVKKRDTFLEESIPYASFAIYPLIHLLKGDVLKAKYLRGVVIRNENTIHVADPRLKTC